MPKFERMSAPTWKSIFRIYVMCICNGNDPDAKLGAWQELERMAELADKYVAAVNKEKMVGQGD